MLPPTPPPPPSSSASAPPLILEPRPSRLLWAWWLALHLVLGATALLVAAPALLTALLVAAVGLHAVVRRPPRAPRLLVLTADGHCGVPDWRLEARPLGPRTLICPGWVCLHLGPGPRSPDILLVADQVGDEEWRRLRAYLTWLRRDSSGLPSRSP